MATSKARQVRIEESAYHELTWMAGQVGWKPNALNSVLVRLFRQVFVALEQNGKLFIEADKGERMMLGLPFSLPTPECRLPQEAPPSSAEPLTGAGTGRK